MKPVKVVVVGALALGLLLAGYFQGYLHGTIGGVHNLLQEDAEELKTHLRGTTHKLHEAGLLNLKAGVVNVTVSEKPFGMHVKPGSSVVEEVFPGFPAQKLGIHQGCIVQTIAGGVVTQGTWLDVFQKTPTPFTLGLFCPPAAMNGQGPLSADKHNYRILVVQRPFGMNVQVNVLPRVIDVLPGSAAERAGVKRGFVLTHVNDQPVDSKTWFNAWQKAPTPSTLTFDTNVTVREDNPFFNGSAEKYTASASSGAAAQPGVSKKDLTKDLSDVVEGYGDFRCDVKALPFGMQVTAPPGTRPIVKGVVEGLPAEEEGVQEGDVLIEIAGTRVDATSWFAAFQLAVPPFGLRFRRKGASDPDAVSAEDGPAGNITVTVSEKPFGMHVRHGDAVVDEVFPGFPAKKLGIRKGCQITEVAKHKVVPGTWYSIFQNVEMPFELSLSCPEKMKQVALPKEAHDYRVLVTQRPFGMNIQVNQIPRVVEVLHGSPAEKSGVKRGFVLKAVDNKPVDDKNWFDVWQKAPTPCVLSFDTQVKLRQDNPWLQQTEDGVIRSRNKNISNAIANNGPKIQDARDSEFDVGAGYSDVRVKVLKLPFGMHVRSLPGKRPTVTDAVLGLPASQAGIRAGDVLVEVAGLPVDSSTWFAAFQQATPPFGMRLRRPDSSNNAVK
jgi:S1-C subfamily serine protease